MHKIVLPIIHATYNICNFKMIGLYGMLNDVII